jgi:hypothetical protein
LKKLLAPILALLLFGCGEDKTLPDGYADNRGAATDAYATSNGSILIASIFPRTPIIAEGGSISLTALVTDGAGRTLESTLAEPVVVSWSSSNSSIASVNKNGGVFGQKLGSATITAIAAKGSQISARYDVVVHVVKRNSLDVAELFFNPMQTYIDLNAERAFRLSAVDHAGTATSLSEGRIYLESNNENVEITPREINLSAKNEAVEVKIRGLQKGFSFITPYYELTSADKSEKIKITGTPLVAQVKDSVETSLPTNAIDGGYDLSIAVGEENGGYKTVYVSHYDKSAKALLSDDFYTSWAHKTIDGGTGTTKDAGRSNAIVLSPFKDNRDLPIIAALKNSRVTLYYQRNRGEAWYETEVTPQDIIDANRSYPQNADRLISLSAFRAPEGSSAVNLLNVAYYDAAKEAVCLVSYVSPKDRQSDSLKCIESKAPPHSVSLSRNNDTGEPRMVYGVHDYVYTDANGTETNISAALYYVSRQSGDLYRESISASDAKAASYASIALDRNNKPMVALREGEYVRVYSREADGTVFTWARDPLSGVDTSQGEIASVAFAIDDYNEPRVAFASNAGGETKIRYARKPPFRNLGGRWTIEEPGQNVGGAHGGSSALVVDSANRAHLVYSVESKKWFNYWAEPNFFDYRAYPVINYSKADLIEEAPKQ